MMLTSISIIAGFSRLVFAQARLGDFPVYFSKLHSTFQTPHRVLFALAPCFSIVLFAVLCFNINLAACIQLPSAIFIALYIIGMLSEVKLLNNSKAGRYCAMIAFICCATIYGFTGWSGLYPIFIAVVGWYAGCNRKQ